MQCTVLDWCENDSTDTITGEVDGNHVVGWYGHTLTEQLTTRAEYQDYITLHYIAIFKMAYSKK